MSTTPRSFLARLADAVGSTLRRLARHDTGLAELDDRALADIGITRSEIASIEAESHRAGWPTRRRIVVGARHA